MMFNTLENENTMKQYSRNCEKFSHTLTRQQRATQLQKKQTSLQHLK